MYEDVKQIVDFGAGAADDDIEVRILGGVWVSLDEDSRT